MNAHELRTSLEKAETQPEIVVRKVEKKLRQAENSQFELRPRFAKRTTLAGPLNRGGLGNSIFPPYQSLTSISQQKLNFLKWPSHTTIVDWSSAGVAQSGLDAAGSTPVRLEPSSLGMQNPVAICQDSVSCPVYFTAPCNRFSLNAFHNISDKVKILFNPISHPFQELRPVCGMHKTPAIPPGPCGSHYRFIPDNRTNLIGPFKPSRRSPVAISHSFKNTLRHNRNTVQPQSLFSGGHPPILLATSFSLGDLDFLHEGFLRSVHSLMKPAHKSPRKPFLSSITEVSRRSLLFVITIALFLGAEAPAAEIPQVVPITTTAESTARSVCSTCHVFPDPSLLPLNIWTNDIFPKMRLYMGLDKVDVSKSKDAEILLKEHYFPDAPIIPESMWDTIHLWYLQKAPGPTNTPSRNELIPVGLKLFKIEPPRFRRSKPLTTLVSIDQKDHGIFTCDANQQSLDLLGSTCDLRASFPVGN